MQDSDARSRVAVVTGGSAGLGRAITRELAARGWDVAVVARGHEGVVAAVEDVEAAGRRGLAVLADVSVNDEVESAAERIEQELGPIDLWVNNAMTGVFGEFLTTNSEDFERATRVVYLGFVNGTRAALKRMIVRDKGHIIQVGSALGHRGIPLQAAYCGSKHAIKGFTESVLTELLQNGSRVRLSEVDMPALNTIQFNWVKSELMYHPQPVPPIYQPEVGARAVAYVADHPRRRTWVGEMTVATVVGNRLSTRVADWYLARTGYSGQQAPEKREPLIGENLYYPVPGDHGAHGLFDGRAHRSSPQTWAITHRTTAWVAAGTALVGVMAAGMTAFRARR